MSETQGSRQRPTLERIGVAMTTLAIVLFFLATIREGSEGGDDDAMYILHARNTVTGVPYAKAGYILNPNYPGPGPQSYPPGYPLLLAPLYAWKGLDPQVMKMESVLFFAAFLVLYFLLVRRDLQFGWALLALVMTGLSPVFWAHKDNVSSDFAFLLFLFAGLLLFEKSRPDAGRGSARPFHAFAASLVPWVATAVRSVGLVVVPAIIASDLIRWRTVRRFTALVAILTAALALTQAMVFPGSADYLERV